VRDFARLGQVSVDVFRVNESGGEEDKFKSKIRSDESGKSSVIVERVKNGAWDNGFKMSYSS